MGRHRNPRSARTARQIGAAASVLVLLGVGFYGYRAVSVPRCSGTVQLSIAAAAEIAPAITSAVSAWKDTEAATAGNRCIAVVVRVADSADVASAIAATKGKTLSGLGNVSGTVVIPDVWIPDSSLWLRRLRAASEGSVPLDPPSIARSPVVLAAPEPVAVSLGWPNAKVTWSDVLSKVKSDTALHIGIVDPARDAAGLASLVTLTGAGGSGTPDGGSAASGGGEMSGASGTGTSTGAGGVASGTSAEARAAVVGALRALAGGRSLVRDDLLRRFPTGTDPTSLASSLSFAPLPEHAVVSYDAAQPPVPIVGIPVLPNPAALDYPYTVLSTTNDVKVEAAAALRTALAGVGFRDRLADSGLRASDGTVGPNFASKPVVSVDPGTQASLPDGWTADHALAAWSTITASSRMLAILDISGSMLETVPTADGATRMTVTIEAARQGLALFDDSWAVGLWTFSTELDGETDYRELAPIGPLTTQRDALNQALSGITPKRAGDTGLYDTLLAAYQAVQSGWDPGRVNSIVLLTDGENYDENGISLDQLVERLKELMDPKKPIQVILLGIGTGTNEASMRRITDVTGGGVFIAEDPAKVGTIFLQAIALRSTSIGG
ncbi:MAG: substrate-binding domain-containing protein [Micromonosporaceae bacterium]|nr:substrate-binding domain-containing protein [Micromonosporaceae bacterium]